MNGTDIKKAAINKAKQVAQAANGNGSSGGKKRRKGQDLKPIITTEQQAAQQQQQQNASPGSTTASHQKYVQPCAPGPQHLHLCLRAQLRLRLLYCITARISPLPTSLPANAPLLTRNPAVHRIPPHPSTSTKCTATS
jgi:hypothetical protein